MPRRSLSVPRACERHFASDCKMHSITCMSHVQARVGMSIVGAWGMVLLSQHRHVSSCQQLPSEASSSPISSIWALPGRTAF